jgi:fatty acid-binding protein DegV
LKLQAPGIIAYITIMHAAVPDRALELSRNLCSVFELNEIPIMDVPPAIVVHAGPGILAAAFFIDG